MVKKRPESHCMPEIWSISTRFHTLTIGISLWDASNMYSSQSYQKSRVRSFPMLSEAENVLEKMFFFSLNRRVFRGFSRKQYSFGQV